MYNPWNKARAQSWYQQQPWGCGFNYLPRTAVNWLEMWQAESFDSSTIDQELGWASQYGYNQLRTNLPFTVWQHDRDGLLERIDLFLNIARSHGIAAFTNPGMNRDFPKGTGCCNDASVFDSAGIPVLSVEATNWSLGKKDGYQQRSKSRSFPQGTSWHDVQLDNLQYIDKALPGRIEHRGRDVMKVMLPLVKELAKVEKVKTGKS